MPMMTVERVWVNIVVVLGYGMVLVGPKYRFRIQKAMVIRRLGPVLLLCPLEIMAGHYYLAAHQFLTVGKAMEPIAMIFGNYMVETVHPNIMQYILQFSLSTTSPLLLR
mgnify:CR=1 FL=1